MTAVFRQPPRVRNTSPFIFGSADGAVVESVRGCSRPGATASSIASVMSTTVPLNTVAAGIRSDRLSQAGTPPPDPTKCLTAGSSPAAAAARARPSSSVLQADGSDPNIAALVRGTADGEQRWLVPPSPSGASVARWQTRELPDSRVPAGAIRLRRPPAGRSLRSATTGGSPSSHLRGY